MVGIKGRGTGYRGTSKMGFLGGNKKKKRVPVNTRARDSGGRQMRTGEFSEEGKEPRLQWERPSAFFGKEWGGSKRRKLISRRLSGGNVRFTAN